jgi:co-chaperonin GroES (HSP10)
MVLEQIVQSTTKAGLTLPDHVVKDFQGFIPQKFRVLAVGADKWTPDYSGTIPCPVKVGDIIIPAGPGACLNFDGTELWLMDTDMVMCKVVSETTYVTDPNG